MEFDAGFDVPDVSFLHELKYSAVIIPIAIANNREIRCCNPSISYVYRNIYDFPVLIFENDIENISFSF